MERIDAGLEDMEVWQSAASITFGFCTPEERPSLFPFLGTTNAPQHWLPLFDEETRDSLGIGGLPTVPAIHFYGFKGGQARSTVLAMLAKSLASLDYRVLLVDVDIEAPSLDQLFNVSAPNISCTLMGLCGWSQEFDPIPVSGSSLTRGAIDLVPCRPRDDTYDMDFAAFSVRSSLDISMVSRGVQRLREYVESSGSPRYDVVLFDHRTGIAPSVLPVVRAWRGPVVVTIRPDGLSMQAVGAIASLFAQNPETPGAYVCFSLDPEDSRKAVFQRAPQQVQQLLDELSLAIQRGADNSVDALENFEAIPADALQSYWISWFADRALLGDLSPPVERLSSTNQESLAKLCEVLGFTGFSVPSTTVASAELSQGPRTHARSPSGAIDAGWFIETAEISKLFLPASPICYVVGRKGTGKTRLYRELVLRKLGEPLFSAADFSDGGIQSQGTAQARLLDACGGDYKSFWWTLFHLAMETSTTNGDELQTKIDAFCSLPTEEQKAKAVAFASVRQFGHSGKSRRYFLIDGIETAVSAANLRHFIEELLLFMLTIQSDSRLSSAVSVRLFLRTDLLRNATQNIEQQTSQRRLDLRWEQNDIFNFVLSRIERIAWFNIHFPAACDSIRAQLDTIKAGKLDAATYKKLLLAIFPEKLRRNNLQTLTFLETYFSDAGGDNLESASFYPRLFEAFLDQIAEVGIKRTERGLPTIDDGRVSHAVVLDAHAAASTAFIAEVTQELYGLLELNENALENRQLVDGLIAALEGRPTPFVLETLVEQLQTTIGTLEPRKIRDALQRMREIGIFESRPGYAGQWRAGRLYKSALKMKYVR
ncbi:MAG TPA: hypothetical protein PLW86_05175 [Rhodocyclaceae bacterium]|nr:hypothetical protein [Rhodocyclaceae bacterium]